MSRLRAFSGAMFLLGNIACTSMPRQERGHPAFSLPLPTDNYSPPALRQPVIYRRAHLDTLILPAGRVLTLYPALRPTYDDLPTPPWLRPTPSADDEELDLTAEERARLRATGHSVQRVGRTLWLRPSAAAPIHFINSPIESEDNITYEYVDTIPAIHQWLISVHLYEGGYFLLIDQRTGRRTEVWSPPAISPDGLHFVCGNSDVLAHYDPSGLQLWTTDGPRLRKLWERQVEWGVSGPRWLDNRTILFEQDYLEKGDVETRLVRLMVMP